MQQHGCAQRQPLRDRPRINISGQQQALKHNHSDGPHRRCSTEHRQDHLGKHRLDAEEKQRGEKARRREHHGARRDVTTLCAVMFTATSFLSALLFFCIEPMFSKMVLPVLGGTSAVWSVAMVVFQGLLLAGYVYAWAITKWLSLRAAMLLHLGLLLAASFCLPVAISALLGEPPSQNIALWLIALFLTSIGLPFFAVAANAPLLQAWFARTSDAYARNAYFLYRASNFGSFMVLLA